MNRKDWQIIRDYNRDLTATRPPPRWVNAALIVAFLVGVFWLADLTLDVLATNDYPDPCGALPPVYGTDC